MIIKLSLINLKNNEEKTLMVLVKFFNLIRSNHGVKEVTVKSGTIAEIVLEIRNLYPQITMQEFHDAVLFINKENSSSICF